MDAFNTSFQDLIGVEEYRTLEQLLKFYTLALRISLALALLAFILNLIFIYIVSRGIRLEQLSTKRYCLVLSRAAADVLSTALTVLWSSLGLARVEFDAVINIVHVLQVSLSYWLVTGSTLALSVIMYLAAKRPLYYRTTLTVRHCVFAVVCIWLFSLMITGALASIGGSAFFSHDCSIAFQKTVLTPLLATLLVSCLSVPLLYLGILASLRKRNSLAVDRPQKNNYWCLAGNIASYCMFNCPFVLLSSAALLLVAHGEGKGAEIDVTVQIFVLRMVASVLLTVRTVVDPILSAAIDYVRFKAVLGNQPASHGGTVPPTNTTIEMSNVLSEPHTSALLDRHSSSTYEKKQRRKKLSTISAPQGVVEVELNGLEGPQSRGLQESAV